MLTTIANISGRSACTRAGCSEKFILLLHQQLILKEVVILDFSESGVAISRNNAISSSLRSIELRLRLNALNTAEKHILAVIVQHLETSIDSRFVIPRG